MSRLIFGLTIFLTLFLVIPPIAAHVPISTQDGETLETAFFIEDPTKSWVIYSDLHKGAEPRYFGFEMDVGERIRILLSIPIITDPNAFQPSIALMGPGFTNSSSIPAFLEVPESAGVMIFESEPATPEYEGFTPTSFYALIDIDMEVVVSGDYYFAVFEEDESGPFSVALGYVESFTFDEWLLVPFDVMIIHQWNGQSLVLILAPMIISVLLGIGYLLSRRRDLLELESTVSWLGVLGGLLFFGSGITIFYQMIVASLTAINAQLIITAIFGIIPILLGFYTLRIVLTDGWKKQRGKRIRLLILGIVAPFLWSGLLIGPALVILSGIVASVGASETYERRYAPH
ncbi:MAG: hypothetical protein AM326_10620 [Candidatus Thorarchaeota archaeon SMTZ-45]|nr:MAG: hypothetical protein AM325_01670 [Candidatus Thorarchaeota archaeon SMTZ1-45]KXH73525.1 MAG: hypothetical protein AM326_10620 [Candidatus Thorarchaeota archaeon SMTZ-45]